MPQRTHPPPRAETPRRTAIQNLERHGVREVDAGRVHRRAHAVATRLERQPLELCAANKGLRDNAGGRLAEDGEQKHVRVWEEIVNAGMRGTGGK